VHINQLETPVAIVDIDRLEANITRLQQYLDQHGIANRPHIKTHKIPEIAHMQINDGAVGVTCQKLGEAEVMAQAGIRDIFLPYNIIGEAKLRHLMSLARRVTISVTADSEVTVRGLSEAVRYEDITLPVLVEFDSGMGRCGVQSPKEAADLARLIVRSPGLHFGGLMTYPTNEKTAQFTREVREILAPDDTPIECVTGGGTHCMWDAHKHPEVTEHRAGMYVYGGHKEVTLGVMSLDDIAFTIVMTLVSRPTADRGILDGGSKTLSSDTRGLDGYGLILEYPEACIYNLSEEHGFVDFSNCERRPTIGERVTVIPNHCCTAANLFNHVVGVRNRTVEVVWPVAARGTVQ
jgi:D-serine deaminase-like pyridoxal phosphate-dependent protein